MSGDTRQSTDPERVVTLTRVFDTPRAEVFRMWIDPAHVARWWGPRGFTNPLCEVDARVGGAIRIEMRGPDGTVYPMTGTFRELAPPERLVFASTALGPDATPLLETLTTVTFAERDGRTTQIVEAQVIRRERGSEPYLAGMEDGWAQSLERLDAHVGASREAARGSGG